MKAGRQCVERGLHLRSARYLRDPHNLFPYGLEDFGLRFAFIIGPEAQGIFILLDRHLKLREGVKSIGPVATGLLIIRLEEDGFFIALEGRLGLL